MIDYGMPEAAAERSGIWALLDEADALAAPQNEDDNDEVEEEEKEEWCYTHQVDWYSEHLEEGKSCAGSIQSSTSPLFLASSVFRIYIA